MPPEFEPTIAPPHPNPSAPRFTPPRGTCDSHCHVFGPAARFPYAPERTFTPHDVPEEALRRRHEWLGIDRAVIVQSACHGTDHAALLAALAAGDGRYRGVALLAPSTPHREVARLHDAGVRGIRLQFMPHLGTAPSDDDVRRLAELVRPYGWHVAVHVAGRGVLDHWDTFAAIPTTLVIDHLGRVDLGEGYEGPAVSAIKRLLDRGNVWLKLSGADRVSRTGPPYEDAADLAASLAAYAPDRVVWGTDFPHPNVSTMPDDGALLDLVPRILPDERLRQMALVDNPARLFDFPPTTSNSLCEPGRAA